MAQVRYMCLRVQLAGVSRLHPRTLSGCTLQTILVPPTQPASRQMWLDWLSPSRQALPHVCCRCCIQHLGQLCCNCGPHCCCIRAQDPARQQPQLASIKVLRLGALTQQIVKPVPPELAILRVQTRRCRCQYTHNRHKQAHHKRECC